MRSNWSKSTVALGMLGMHVLALTVLLAMLAVCIP
jgi:hypothetical protein